MLNRWIRYKQAFVDATKACSSVEVRGVEPRSEEKTLKTSTYLAFLLVSRKETPEDRIGLTLSQVDPLAADSSVVPENDHRLSHLSRRSSCSRWARSKRNGLPNRC